MRAHTAARRSARLISLGAALTLAAGLVAAPGPSPAAPPIPVNVAEGMAASQSSTFANAAASRAVDGNTHGTYNHGSVSHTEREPEPWWQVDLGEVTEVAEIVLWNRTDCCSQRLRDVHVFVSDTPITADAIADVQTDPEILDVFLAGSQATETRIDVGRTGRYVRVQLQGTEHLQLAEVEVLSLLDQAGQPGEGSLDVDVFVDGIAAFEAPGPPVVAGDRVAVTFEVVNDGDGDLWGVYLYAGGLGEVPCPERHLAPDERMMCEATITAGTGERSFRADVDGWTTAGDQVAASATVHYVGDGVSSDGLTNLSLGKEARQSDTMPGHPARLAVDGNRDGDAANGSVSMTHRIVESYWEVDLGDVYEIDHVTLWNRTDCCAQRLRDFHLFVSDEPFEYDDLEYVMELPGVFDLHHRESAGRRTDIPVGRTGRYVRVQAEYRDAIVALAEVEVMGRDGTAAVPPSSPDLTALEVRALVNGEDADEAPGPAVPVGDPVVLTYEVTNTGTEYLWALYVWDDEIGHVDTCPGRDLAPGATVVCTVEITSTPGGHGGRSEAAAWDAAGTEAFDADTAHWIGGDGSATGPALDVEAFVAGEDADALPGPEFPAGAAVDFDYQITNVGTERLWALSVWHEGIGPVQCPATALAPGDTIPCEASGTAAPGETVQTVFADAWDATGAKASDTDPVAYRGATPSTGPRLQVESLVNGEDADQPPGVTIAAGSPATWSYEVTNTGDEDLWALWLYDREHGTVTCPDRSLPVGGSVTCTVETVPQEGLHTSSVEALAWSTAGDEAGDTDRHHYFVAQPGARVEIDALVDGLDGWWQYGPRIREGEMMTFSYLVANTGTEPLTDVVVTDDRLGPADCPASMVAPGEIMTCVAREEAELGLYMTYGRVTATGGGTQVSDEDRLDWHVKPTGRNEDISLTITVNGEEASQPTGPMIPAGEPVQLRYVVTNLGTWTSMYSIEVLDPQVPASQMSCTNADQNYLTQTICTATITAQPGQQVTLVVAHAWSGNGVRMEETEYVHYYGLP